MEHLRLVLPVARLAAFYSMKLAASTPTNFFSEKVPDILLEELLKEADNPIYLIELLACYIISLFLWGPVSLGKYVVSYIDNEASRLALIKAYSTTKVGNINVRMYVLAEEEWQWKTCFGRVCSHSNPADDPSRFEVAHLTQSGSFQLHVPWDQVILRFQATQHSV